MVRPLRVNPVRLVLPGLPRPPSRRLPSAVWAQPCKVQRAKELRGVLESLPPARRQGTLRLYSRTRKKTTSVITGWQCGPCYERCLARPWVLTRVPRIGTGTRQGIPACIPAGSALYSHPDDQTHVDELPLLPCNCTDSPYGTHLPPRRRSVPLRRLKSQNQRPSPQGSLQGRGWARSGRRDARRRPRPSI